MIRRTTVTVDEDLLKSAQAALGTSGVKDTIEEALAEVVRAHLRRRLADRIKHQRGIDLGAAILRASRR